MIPEQDIEKVSDATDFVALVAETCQVKQKGRTWWCCCPFHKEKTPSMQIDPSQNLWHCFGCGEGGSVFGYVMKLHNISFAEAVHMLADRAHIEISDTSSGVNSARREANARLKECCETACRFFELQLLRGKSAPCKAARDYLSARKFGLDVAKSWHLGFAIGSTTLRDHLAGQGFSDKEISEANLGVRRGNEVKDRFFNRVMFPIFNERGECVAFGGRVLGDGQPKYLNSSETPIFHKSKVLFGLDKAKEEMIRTGDAVVVEGYTDVIALHEAGIKNAVATLGTSLTIQHIKLLNRYASKKIIYLFDGDEAGQRAAERALQFIDYSITPEAGNSRCDLHAVVLPDNLDPADFVSTRGGEALGELLSHSRSLIEFGISRRINKYNLSEPEGRSRALMDAISILAPIKDSMLAKDYAVSIASRLRVSESDALNKLSSLASGKSQGSYSATPASVASPNTTQPQKSESVSDHELGAEAKNRLKNERDVSVLCVRFPSLALEFADLLENVNWKSSRYRLISTSTMEALSEDLNKTSSQIASELRVKLKDLDKTLSELLDVSDEESAREIVRISLYSCLIEDTRDEIEKRNMNLAKGDMDRSASQSALNEIKLLTDKMREYENLRVQS